MTLERLGLAQSEALHHCAVWITAGGEFLGSGFLAGPGLVVTAAHVVTGKQVLAVGHASGSHPVAEVRAEPPRGDGGLFHPFPDLAALTVPDWPDHPVAALAQADPPPGAPVTALGYSTWTPSPGVQPDTLALRVEGRSGAFVRVLGDGVRDGHSGSMLAGPDGLVHGVLKGSRSYRQDQGGWFVPVTALRAFLGLTVSQAPSTVDRSVNDADLVEGLMRFPAMARTESRYDLLEKMGRHLGLPYSFEAEDAPERRDHLYRIVRRCRHYRDPHAAFRALYTALEELVPYDGALSGFQELVGRAIGGWGSV
ncbi:trypsin-like peptidase domain-containing protein [Kitasatospora azatica]|uniref:trypsin-like peptidase domain-containing protein n=1 Tax=Kitasatospora azatica TaxID=58347 RepID=UPI0005670FA6|nr:trypsin-like peptidase domain-containing protein [Kitasatospora azatica]